MTDGAITPRYHAEIVAIAAKAELCKRLLQPAQAGSQS
jgi:hypothetical protein